MPVYRIEFHVQAEFDTAVRADCAEEAVAAAEEYWKDDLIYDYETKVECLPDDHHYDVDAEDYPPEDDEVEVPAD